MQLNQSICFAGHLKISHICFEGDEERGRMGGILLVVRKMSMSPGGGLGRTFP